MLRSTMKERTNRRNLATQEEKNLLFFLLLRQIDHILFFILRG